MWIKAPVAEHRVKQWQENISTIICQSVTERRELAKHVQRASKEVSVGSGWDLGETLGGEKLLEKKRCTMQNNFNKCKKHQIRSLQSILG